jgi:mono/diheme cytochrome c family protein
LLLGLLTTELVVVAGLLTHDTSPGHASHDRVPSVRLMALLSSAEALQAQPSEGDVEAGREVFESYCAMCHGADATGMMGMHPSLRGAVERLTREGVEVTIRKGRRTTPPMPAFEGRLSDEQITDVVAYIASLPPGPRNFGPEAGGGGGMGDMMDDRRDRDGRDAGSFGLAVAAVALVLGAGVVVVLAARHHRRDMSGVEKARAVLGATPPASSPGRSISSVAETSRPKTTGRGVGAMTTAAPHVIGVAQPPG